MALNQVQKVTAEWFARAPVLLERVRGVATVRQLREGIDLVSSPMRGYETTMVSSRLVGHQLWTRVGLTLDPSRPLVDGDDRSDRFRLQLDRHHNIVDECAREFAGFDITRTIKERVVRSGTIVSAFLDDPLAERDTTVELAIFGWEVPTALVVEAEKFISQGVQ